MTLLNHSQVLGLESLQKLKFEVDNDRNINAIVNSVNKTLVSGRGINWAIHGDAGPGLLDEWQMLNVCETGECKVTWGNKLPAKYGFHTVRLRYKND